MAKGGRPAGSLRRTDGGETPKYALRTRRRAAASGSGRAGEEGGRDRPRQSRLLAARCAVYKSIFFHLRRFWSSFDELTAEFLPENVWKSPIPQLMSSAVDRNTFGCVPSLGKLRRRHLIKYPLKTTLHNCCKGGGKARRISTASCDLCTLTKELLPYCLSS